MGIIKEPLSVDFEVVNRPLTKEEEILISEYIKSQKSKRDLVLAAKKRVSKQNEKA